MKRRDFHPLKKKKLVEVVSVVTHTNIGWSAVATERDTELGQKLPDTTAIVGEHGDEVAVVRR